MPFKDVNVLESEELRQGVKAYTNWPTIPQLYIKGEFVGGSDIMMEMFQSGELKSHARRKGRARSGLKFSLPLREVGRRRPAYLPSVGPD